MMTLVKNLTLKYQAIDKRTYIFALKVVYSKLLPISLIYAANLPIIESITSHKARVSMLNRSIHLKNLHFALHKPRKNRTRLKVLKLLAQI